MKTLLLVVILLQVPVSATSSISGHVITFPGRPAPSTLTLRIYGQNNNGGRMNLRSVPVNPDGSFVISGVTPGEFSLSLGDPLNSLGRNFTFRAGNVSDFEIKIPAEIPGRVETVDGTNFRSGSIVLITTTPVDASGLNQAAPKTMTNRTQFGTTGTLGLTVFPGENSIRVETLPNGYIVKSMTCGSVDLQRNPLQLDSIPASPIVVTLERQ